MTQTPSPMEQWSFKQRILLALIPRFFALILWFLSLTIRKRAVFQGDPWAYWNQGKFILAAFWHQHILMMPFSPHCGRIGMMVSRHLDGEYIARAVKPFGIDSIRGSTTRGALSAIRGMVRFYRSGGNLAITPDGPQGPKHVVQVGIMELARQTGGPVFPIAWSASRKKVFNSWDNFILPLPFCRVVYLFGEPLLVPADTDREALEEKRLFLQERMRDLAREAERLGGRVPEET